MILCCVAVIKLQQTSRNSELLWKKRTTKFHRTKKKTHSEKSRSLSSDSGIQKRRKKKIPTEYRVCVHFVIQRTIVNYNKLKHIFVFDSISSDLNNKKNTKISSVKQLNKQHKIMFQNV